MLLLPCHVKGKNTDQVNIDVLIVHRRPLATFYVRCAALSINRDLSCCAFYDPDLSSDLSKLKYNEKIIRLIKIKEMQD